MPANGDDALAQKTVNTLRGLAMDAVQAAKSGHPGMPMGCAAMGYAIFARHLRFDPEAPEWFNRDRFILSAGHGSMLLYGLLHLTGYDLSLDEIRRFRQWGSKTPGHPENTLAPGVEMATGPLGQGFATGVGMAIAEEKLRAEFPGLVDHWTYAICSDGDLMEGVSHEAASLAGHLKLGRLIYLYDSNHITIDGSTALAFSENVRTRFEAYGWQVLECDGLSVEDVDARIAEAKSDTRPSLIVCKTVIGYGSPHKAGSEAAHGAPLGEEEVKLSKEALGIPLDPSFLVPAEVYEHMLGIGARHRSERLRSEAALAEAPELCRRLNGDLVAFWDQSVPDMPEPIATRAASGKVLNAAAAAMPEILGGSADLAESNQTEIKGASAFNAENRNGRNIHFGVREHAMGCALNGINLHGGLRAFGGTFLIFSDYMRPSIRLAALMECPSIFVFTHDSIGLGEDGPTHQPIEHLASLRAIPDLWVIRPCDSNEVIHAWKMAFAHTDGPTAIVLSRQPLPALSPRENDGFQLGAYVLQPASDSPQVALIGTGSEVEICAAAREKLEEIGVPTCVVSMPCWELFERAGEAYQEAVLPSGTVRISVEAGATLGWHRWLGANGFALGLDHFGASAPYKEIYREFGLTADAVVAHALRLL
jgi:transketolase